MDGIPLALEIAARWVGLMPVAQLAERIQADAGLLDLSVRLTHPRHSTLRKVIDWSYRSLDEQEAALLRRLAIFHGPFSAEAARAVFGGDARAQAGVVAMLYALVNKALLTPVREGEREKFRVLEVIREYGAYKLREADEYDTTSARHRAFYGDLAQRAGAELMGERQAEWAAHLDGELGNLFAALDSALAAGATREAADMLLALERFWLLRNHFAESLPYFERVLGALPSEGALARAYLLSCVAEFAWRIEDWRTARDILNDVLHVYEAHHDVRRVAQTRFQLAANLWSTGELRAARDHATHSLQLFSALDDALGEARAHTVLAEIARVGADLAAAQSHNAAALERNLRAGERRGQAVNLLNLGLIAVAQGALDVARTYLVDSARIMSALGDFHQGPYVLHGMVLIAIELHKYEAAALATGSIDALGKRLSFRLWPVDQEAHRDAIGALRHALGTMRFDALAREGRALSFEQTIEMISHALDRAPVSDPAQPIPDKLSKKSQPTASGCRSA
jgi:non-specific serine/threonine protein kinase